MNFILPPDISEKKILDSKLIDDSIYFLTVYNDDVNTFKFVIDLLVKICGHNVIQAEQCAYLIHFTGKCVVKNGTFKKLKSLCEALLENGLSAKIEKS